MVIAVMELKEAILQTLAEIDTKGDYLQDSDNIDGKPERDALLDIIPSDDFDEIPQIESAYKRKIEKLNYKNADELKELLEKYYLDEEKFLESLQDRILVLFEGLQSPNNRNIEVKLDMVLNFLEFTLAIIDERKSAK